MCICILAYLVMVMMVMVTVGVMKIWNDGNLSWRLWWNLGGFRRKFGVDAVNGVAREGV